MAKASKIQMATIWLMPDSYHIWHNPYDSQSVLLYGARVTFPYSFLVYGHNVPRQNVPRQNVPDKMSRDKMSRDKMSRDKTSPDKMSPDIYVSTLMRLISSPNGERPNNTILHIYHKYNANSGVFFQKFKFNR